MGIAVSGGPDSVALLLLAHAALPGRVSAATVDHGLRPESAGEAAFVASVCGGLDLPHATLAVQVDPGNLQANARAARYEALGGHFARLGIAAFATAHHADDQAETLLMRLNRGSGLSGLAGVRPLTIVSPDAVAAKLALVRPLLGWRRAELRQVVTDAGIDPVEDPSNSDDAYDRARMRKAIAELDWLDPLAMARSAAHLAEAESAITEQVDAAIRTLIWDEEGCRFILGHPRPVEIGVVAHVLKRMGAPHPRKSEIARLLDRVVEGENASLGGVLARRAIVDTGANTHSVGIRFEREPPRRADGTQVR
ncbi:tRNA lysidine(34) synthetase TilS [Alteriqipengyuania sp. 357]